MSVDDVIVSIPALKPSESTVTWYPLLGGAGGGVQETDIIPLVLSCLNVRSIGADPNKHINDVHEQVVTYSIEKQGSQAQKKDTGYN